MIADIRKNHNKTPLLELRSFLIIVYNFKLVKIFQMDAKTKVIIISSGADKIYFINYDKNSMKIDFFLI
jgi:hypothetical protein